MASMVENVCKTPGCGKPASMSCPTCLKLGLEAARFCSQECFKGYWGVHKAVHTEAKLKIKALLDQQQILARKAAEGVEGFKRFKFTGPLRPGKVTAGRAVPPHIVRPDYADHPQGHAISEIKDKTTNSSIKVYTDKELEGVRAACVIGRAVLDAGGKAVGVGVTCDEIDRVVHEATIAHDAYPSPLNYYNFPKSVCTSVNEVICHGVPDDRPLEDGDIVNIDVSVYVGGYHADLNETFFVGKQTDESKKLVKCAYDCLSAAVAMCKPGVLYKDIGTAITMRAIKDKCSVVKSYCGHGTGVLFHTQPNVPHYAKNKAKGVMQPGHVFTIEPMINLGVADDIMWPDNWTAPTADGKRSAQFEHTMVVTTTGVELLTARLGEPTDRMVWDDDKFCR